MILLRYAFLRWLEPRIEPYMTWHVHVAIGLLALTSFMGAAKYNELHPLEEPSATTSIRLPSTSHGMESR